MALTKKSGKRPSSTRETSPPCACPPCRRTGRKGIPARLTVSVTLTVTANNTLRLSYEAASDKDTVLNLTNHAYFNLNGYDGGDVLDTVLTIHADAITPVDDRLIPTGELLPVEGTPFDFRKGQTIGAALAASHPQLKIGGGVDHNFVLGDNRAPAPRRARGQPPQRPGRGLLDRSARRAGVYRQLPRGGRGQGRDQPLPAPRLLHGNPVFPR